MSLHGVQHDLLLLWQKHPFALAHTVVHPLSEMACQIVGNLLPFVVRLIVEQVLESFGVAHRLRRSEVRAFAFHALQSFGTDDFPIFLLFRHAFCGQMAQATSGFGALAVEAQGVFVGDFLGIDFCSHNSLLFKIIENVRYQG